MTQIRFTSLTPNPSFQMVWDVNPQDVWNFRSQLLIIDVRREDEFYGELGHIPQAQHIVLDELESKIPQLPKDKAIVFICRSGARSAQASMWASQMGLKNTYNMKGGMIRWNEENLETEGKN